MNEIITKKMIMVHRIHLVLCCYNCFYKLIEGNEFSCILCDSSNELFNCQKCNRNVCNRCIEIHKIDTISNGVVIKCFNCQPHILWKQRAKTANVLKIFSSQLDFPNGLLVNETEREQMVRKYLVEEAKKGQNSKTDNIKDQLCLNFILNSYKSNVNKVLEFSLNPENDDSSSSINDNLIGFIQNCEIIIEKTCSTLTCVKRVFKLNSQLNPSVTAMMKSLLKSFDEDENVPDSSRKSKSLSKIVNKTNENQSPNISNSKTRSSEKTHNVDESNLNSQISSSSVNVQLSNNQINKNLAVVVERLDISDLSKKKGYKPFNVLNDDHVKEDDIDHPLDLLDDDNISSEEDGKRKLRSRKVKKTDEKKQKTQSEKSTKNKKIAKSDDEKENDRLINLSNIEKRSKYKMIRDEDCSVTDDTNTNIVKQKIPTKISKNDVNMIEKINETIENIDETSSSHVGTDDDLQENEISLKSVKDVFSEMLNTIGVSKMNTESCNSESDDSCLDDVINSTLNICKRPGIKHYLEKSKKNLLDIDDINNMETNDMPDELENGENTDSSDFSDEFTSMVTRSKPLSRIKMPSSSNESDSDLAEKKIKGTKRKVKYSSSSDSSSKYFKNTPKKKNLIYSSDSSSDEDKFSILKRKRNKKQYNTILDESNQDSSDHSTISKTYTPPKKGRKNIRKLKKETELSQLTLNALEEEASRKKRIEQRQKLYNKMYVLPKPMESCKKLVLDFDPETKEELVVVHPDLVKFLKPHQVEGIRFLWNSVFESLAQVKNNKGSGSIIAHCMGLGKTLQVITLVHTLYRYPEMDIKTILVITPHSTIENWCIEFHKWLKDIPEEKNFTVFNFSESKTYGSRNSMINEWQKKRGVLILSYTMFRTVINYKFIKKYPSILKGLVDPGPDVVICDEGHLLKNHISAQSKAVNRIKTLRRIVLTGTPLQNNLKEYHCMVDFIRPNLLGSLKDFSNRFISPITNGQYSDSTAFDVKLMKRRSHVLHRMLEGFVQRFDYSVLTPFLPPKHEYVIYLKLSEKQIELYQHYLDNFRQQQMLFSNYHMLQMIWTHPKLLELYSRRAETRRERQLMEFLDDSNTSTNDSNSGEADNEQIPAQVVESTRSRCPEIDINWWKPLVSKKDLETVYPYSKFLMMFSILKECEEIGDKVLIFSQSLLTLDLIQEFLINAEDLSDDGGGPYGSSWTIGEDFFRLDGSSKDRENCCSQFNDLTNTKMRLLLLSTKAFNLGINLIAANRVIIFDVTWNPSLNVQSIFRVFRFGQNKPCYIYRLISEGTMEQKMYERQISKLSLAFRVVDEHQIDRHFNARDQEELYEFAPNTKEPKSTLNLPKDRMMAELILKHKDLVMDILEHDSLLQNNEAEELDEEDRNAAWDDYQKEKDRDLNRVQKSFNNQINNQSNNDSNRFNNPQLSYQPLPEDEKLFNTLRSVFPQANKIQLNDMFNQVRTKALDDEIYTLES